MWSLLRDRLDLRFVLALSVYVSAVLLAFRDEVVGPAVLPLRVLTAKATQALIHGLGMEAVREATVISHPAGFAYDITRGCTAFVAMGFLTVAILAYRADLRPKLLGLAVGIPALLALNLVRLVHLFYLGVYRPDLFRLAHQVVWQAVIVLAVFGLWHAWRTWLERKGTGLVVSSEVSTERQARKRDSGRTDPGRLPARHVLGR